MTLLKQKLHIIKTVCVGAVFKNVLGVFTVMIDFDIFGLYLCIW